MTANGKINTGQQLIRQMANNPVGLASKNKTNTKLRLVVNNMIKLSRKNETAVQFVRLLLALAHGSL